MARLGRWLALTSAGVVTLLLVGGPSYADGLQKCLDQSIDHNGEMPVCTKVNGTWVASWPDSGPGPDSGFGGFVAFVVIVGIIGAVVTTFWKVSTARRLATQSGMDPGLATGMTLLSQDGLDATYLAANLRGTARPAPAATTETGPASPAGASVTSRLEELRSLLDRGLVTQAEYDTRRQAILDSI